MAITTIFIDLDGTLYPNENGIWEQIAARMEMYMDKVLSIPTAEIPSLRQSYFRQYGTTLRGLQANYSVDPLHFLAFVHDIQLDRYLKPDPLLNVMLDSLPHPKWILTNADRAHAERVLNTLGVADCFAGILDITALQFINKPDPAVFSMALSAAGDPPPHACLFADDIPHNLIPAAQYGIYTVLVGKHDPIPEAQFHIPDIYALPSVLDQLEGHLEN